MSLYADEDIATATDPSLALAGPSSSASDPLQAFAAAITLPAESAQQADALIQAAQRFEEHPENLPVVCAQVLPIVVDGGDSLLRSWTLEMVGLAVGRSALEGEVKISVAQTSLEALSKLLNSDSVATVKAVIPIFSTIHPILFRLLATSRPPQRIYDLFTSSKTRIVSLALDPSAQPQNVGVKATAWKFIQKVMIAGTRTAAADPRQVNSGTDPNVNLITRDSFLNAAELEEEAILLRNQLVSQLFTLSDPAILHPIIQTIPLLCKSRPNLAPAFITSLTSWTPAALEAKGRPAMVVRAVEKSLRMAMAHLLKYPPLSQFSAQLNDALYRQKSRLEIAWASEQESKRLKKAAAAAAVTPISAAGVLGKHPNPMEAESSTQAAKRARLEVLQGSGKGKGPEVDVSGLELDFVVEVVMKGLEVVDAELMRVAFDNARRNLQEGNQDALPVLASLLGMSEVKEEEDEVLNPLDMDMDDDDDDLLMADDDALAENEAITFADFSLPPPEPLDPTDRADLLDTLIERIWTNGGALADAADQSAKAMEMELGMEMEGSDGIRSVVQPKEMWMLLLARLAARGDIARKRIGESVTADFAARSKFASIWLNEEWYSQKLSNPTQPPTRYTSSLDAILTAYLPKIDSKDKSLSAFLSSLPELPTTIVDKLEKLCEDPDRSIVGFLALRDLVETRPPIRDYALDTLLQLCTYPDRKIRVLAISTVRRWVPDSAMSRAVLSFALGVLRRLVQVQPTSDTVKKEETGGDGEEEKNEEKGKGKGKEKDATRDIDMEDGEETETPISTRYLLGPITSETVQQHVELPFALSRRSQDLLDDIFHLYPRLTPEIQETVETLFSPLVQSLGPTPKLQEILRDFPEGADKLVLRTMTVLSADGKTGVVRDLVRGLMKDRELDPKFIIPIIGTLDKAEVEKQIPRVVSLLSSPSSRDLVRTAFASLLQKLTPADLLVILHTTDEARPSSDPASSDTLPTPTPAPAPNLKATIEAIGICFSMTSVFRSDVLASSLTRIADLPDLPIVFMRTVIQAVTTYKSLIPFVANTVLPKLVARKIWQQPTFPPALWDGFVRLAKLIAPHSFGALLQLPKEQLKDAVDKQPGLKAGLKGFLGTKPQAKAALQEVSAICHLTVAVPQREVKAKK